MQRRSSRSNMGVVVCGRLLVFVLLMYSCAAQITSDQEDKRTSVDSEEANNSSEVTYDFPPAKKNLYERCGSKYTISCIKLSLVRILERISKKPTYELLPGLSVQSDMSVLQDVPRDITQHDLDDILLRSLTKYLTSLSLSVKVLDSRVFQGLKQVGEKFVEPEENTSTGRRRRYGSTMMMAGLMSGGTMMTLAMSALAAMAGKALMTSLLSLMLSAMSAFKGSGGGGEKTTYEIIHPHDGHKHRSLETDGLLESESGYPYATANGIPVGKRNMYIPIHKR